MKRKLFLLLILSLLFSACNLPSSDPNSGEIEQPDSVDAASLSLTATEAVDAKGTLTVCTTSLPTSLFPYDTEQSNVKDSMLAIMREGPFDQSGNGLEPVILEKVPSQADGDLRLESVTVQAGQVIVDADGGIAVLDVGIAVRPSGCRHSDCVITWDGEGTLEMDQMVVEFHLRDDLVWSDGAPLSAEDSIFSFELASTSEASGLKWAEDRTNVYTALDATTIQWRGLPGFTNAELDNFFWSPLPSHLFTDSETWTEISTHQNMFFSPLSYGPFILTARDGNMFVFESNPTYFRLNEGLPILDEITFKVVEGGVREAWGLLQSGDCDVLDTSFGLENHQELLTEILADEQYELHTESNDSWTQLVFGIQPMTYDGNFDLSEGDRPDYFGDERTRRAIAMSLDRATMLGITTQGLGLIWPSFLPPSQSQLDEGDQLSYDLTTSAQLLNDVGWRDHDGSAETPLQAWQVENVPVGTEFIVDLVISQSDFHWDLAEVIRESLQAVGISVVVSVYPSEDLYASGPDGILFGRRFDMALISWMGAAAPDCSLYQSWQIPSDDNLWIGTNIAGLFDSAFDRMCTDAALALPDESDAALLAAELNFMDALPAIPLVSNSELLVSRINSCGESSSRGNQSFFDAIEEYVDEKNCP